MLEHADHADDRRRIDRAAVGLIVEAHVAAGNRHVERAAGGRDPLDGFRELPHDRRPLGVSEIQAVGRAARPRAGARHVSSRLGDRQHRAAIRVEVTVAAVAVQRQRKRALRPFNADDSGAEARHVQRVRAHGVVVLAVHPVLAADRGRAEEHQQRRGVVARLRASRCLRLVSREPFRRTQRVEIELLHLRQIRRRLHRAAIDRRIVGERAVRNVGDNRASILHTQAAIGRDLPDPRCVKIPFLENPLDLLLAPALDDEQHPLLRLGQHDLVRRHAALALWNERDVDLDACAAARSHFRRRAGQPGRAHVLDPDQRVGAHHLQAGFEQELLHERIADLHGRPLFRRFLAELGGRHRRAVDAVAAGLGPDVVHGVAGA